MAIFTSILRCDWSGRGHFCIGLSTELLQRRVLVGDPAIIVQIMLLESNSDVGQQEVLHDNYLNTVILNLIYPR